MRTMVHLVCVGAAAVAVMGGLAACGGGSSSTTGSAASSQTTTASVTTASADQGGDVAPLSDAQKLQMTVILEAINPGMGTDDDALLGKSIALCKEIRAGKSPSEVEVAARAFYTNGSYTPSPEEAQAIVKATTATFCT